MKLLINSLKIILIFSIITFSINCQTKFQSLVEAMEEEDPTHFKDLIDEVDDINMTNEHGETLLFRAARDNKKVIASILIDKGINAKLTDSGARSALNWAIFNDSLDTFIIVLDGSQNLKDDRNYLEGILLDAIELNKVAFVNPLLDKYFSINDTLTRTHRTILSSALAYAHQNKDVIRLLVKRGADVSLIDADGKSPIFRLELGADIDCLTSLIKAGANLNQRDKDNHTAMYYWAKTKRTWLIREALDHGAIPEKYLYVIEVRERSYETTRDNVNFKYSEYAKKVQIEHGGIVNEKVQTTEKFSEENKIPLLEYATKHDKELFQKLKSIGYE